MKARRGVGLMAFFVTLLTAATLLAEPTATPTDRTWLRQQAPRAASAAPSAHMSAGKWAALALLLGIAGFAVWKRRQIRHADPVVANSHVRIGAVTKISPKAQLVVATVNGRSMLLGVTEGSINRLMWLDGHDDEDIDDDPTSHDQESGKFGEALRGTQESRSNDNAPRRPFGMRQAKSAASIAKSTPARRARSKFREILADAIGLAPRIDPAPTVAKAPVDDLVVGAEDRYVGRDMRRTNTARLGGRASTTVPMIDIEGQAAGLVARLNRS